VRKKMQETKMSETQKDEHGCIIGKEVWNEEQQKCLPIPSPSVEIQNKTVKMSMDEALARIPALEAEVKEKNKLITDLTKQLDEANKILDGQEKAKLINEILPRSSYKMDFLINKTVDELKSIKNTLANAMPPKVNSVRFGVLGTDLSDREKGLTVGDLSVVTAAKRRAD
jgi:hypothetical protein